MSTTADEKVVSQRDATAHDHAWRRVYRESVNASLPREVYCCDLCTAIWST